MSLKKLKSVGTYEEINGGAHRKPASIVGVSSLVRHIAFWDVSNNNQAERIDRYNKYIDDLRHSLIICSDYVRADIEELDISKAESDRGTVNTFRFWWFGVRATVRLEMETEYVTLKSILDISVRSAMNSIEDDDIISQTGLRRDLIELFNVIAETFNRPASKKIRISPEFRDQIQNRFGKHSRQI